MKDKEPIQWGRMRHLTRNVDVGISILISIFFVVVINYLASIFYWKHDLISLRLHTLSSESHAVLSEVERPVKLTYLFQPSHFVFDYVEQLLNAYRDASALIDVEHIDPDRDFSEVQQLVDAFSISEKNGLLLQQENKHIFIPLEQLYTDFSVGDGSSEADKQMFFTGEQALAAALRSLQEEEHIRIYAIQGHGEKSLDSYDKKNGLSQIKQLLHIQGITVSSLRIGEVGAVPDDADGLLLLGPSRALAYPEILALREYLTKGGRLLALLDQMDDEGLLQLFRDWGVSCDARLILDPKHSLTGKDVFVSHFSDHPITKNFQNLSVAFYQPRVVEPIHDMELEDTPVDRPQVASIISCSSDGWAESDYLLEPFTFNAERDRKGPVSFGVASSLGRTSLGGKIGDASRIVLIGDSDFIANDRLAGGAQDLFLNALHWVLGNEQWTQSLPKPIHEIRIALTRRQLSRMFWVLTAAIPGVVLLLGISVWWRRRK